MAPRQINPNTLLLGNKKIMVVPIKKKWSKLRVFATILGVGAFVVGCVLWYVFY